MPANENHHQCTASDIVKDMMELNKKVLKQLEEVGIKVGGYSLGKKLEPQAPRDLPKQGFRGTPTGRPGFTITGG